MREWNTGLDWVNPSHPDPGRREKINLNFYFHTSLWCIKRFYEGEMHGARNFKLVFQPEVAKGFSWRGVV